MKIAVPLEGWTEEGRVCLRFAGRLDWERDRERAGGGGILKHTNAIQGRTSPPPVSKQVCISKKFTKIEQLWLFWSAFVGLPTFRFYFLPLPPRFFYLCKEENLCTCFKIETSLRALCTETMNRLLMHSTLCTRISICNGPPLCTLQVFFCTSKSQ